jgi:hypothetical protein
MSQFAYLKREWPALFDLDPPSHLRNNMNSIIGLSDHLHLPSVDSV